MAAAWRGLVGGRSFCRDTSGPDLGWPAVHREGDEGRFAAAVAPYADRHLRRDPLIAFARDAAEEALLDAGLTTTQNGTVAPSFGCVAGTSKGGLLTVLESFRGTVPAPFEFDPGCVARYLAADFGLGAGAIAPVAACATGLVAIGHAADLVRHGCWTAALAGGADASLHPAVLASYRRLGVLARGDGDVERWARPFDADRRGS